MTDPLYKPKGYVYDYPRYKITVNVVCVRRSPEVYAENTRPLEVLLVLRNEEPAKGQWALPGGNLDPHESFNEAASRELREETGIDMPPGYMAQICAMDDKTLYDGERAFDIGMFCNCTTNTEAVAGSDAAKCIWVPIEQILAPTFQLPFTHKDIIKAALER